MHRLCEFAADTPVQGIPGEVRECARTVLIDTVGVIVGGSASPEAEALAARFAESPEGSSRFGGGGRYAPQDAALLNGLAGSTLEFEEGNSRARGHPAIQLLPAVAAVCEARRSSGDTLVASLVVGYEAAARISRAVSLRKGFHPSGTWGTVGAALGVGRALSRSAEELFEVANLAAGFCLSPYVRNSFAGYSAAASFAALANHLAVLANGFFDAGLRADPGSFGTAFSKFVSESLAWEELEKGLGSEFAIASGYLKPYPTCRFTHPALDALESLLARETIPADEVTAIEVATFDAAAHTAHATPRNVEAMRFSVPYLLAARLCGGALGLAALTDACLEDARLCGLAARISVSARPELESLRPERSPARLEVRLRDGRVLRSEVLSCRGDPDRPLARGEVDAKFLGLAEPRLGPENARSFLAGARRVEELRDVRGLLAGLGVAREGTGA